MTPRSGPGSPPAALGIGTQLGYPEGVPFQALFPTLLYASQLDAKAPHRLNRQLVKEARQLRADDAAGRRWSARNYPHGYTSYASAHRLQRLSPTFDLLRLKLERHVRAFAREVEWDLGGRTLAMTDCWVNIMPRHAGHGLHLHPTSVLSGTYYVQVPRGSPGLKFEDPRLERFMAAPPRRAAARPENRPWITVPAKAGALVLFESWLRHEVAPHPGPGERVSVSFNYAWA